MFLLYPKDAALENFCVLTGRKGKTQGLMERFGAPWEHQPCWEQRLRITPWCCSPLRRGHFPKAGGYKVCTGALSMAAALSLSHTGEFLSFCVFFLAQAPWQVPLSAPPAFSSARPTSSQLIHPPGADDPCGSHPAQVILGFSLFSSEHPQTLH